MDGDRDDGRFPPVIDHVALSASGDEAIAALRSACEDTGFFVLANHGLDAELDALFDATHRFFALPQTDKEAVPRIDRYGFVPHRDMATADATASGRKLGTNEFVDLGTHGEVPLPPVGGLLDAIATYQTAALAVAVPLLRALAVSLGVDAAFFAERMTDPQCRLRLLHYPPTALLADGSRAVPQSPHTDYGAITMLATDGVPGLEVRVRGGEWTPLEAPPGALVINLGDMLARWTNERYTSTPHRVVGTPDRHRYSIPFFVNPDPATVIDVIDQCVSADAPRLHEPITAGEFLAMRIDDAVAEPYVDATEGPSRAGGYE